jgi:hypothetical protein
MRRIFPQKSTDTGRGLLTWTREICNHKTYELHKKENDGGPTDKGENE